MKRRYDGLSDEELSEAWGAFNGSITRSIFSNILVHQGLRKIRMPPTRYGNTRGIISNGSIKPVGFFIGMEALFAGANSQIVHVYGAYVDSFGVIPDYVDPLIESKQVWKSP
jgi:hypothetical protein